MLTDITNERNVQGTDITSEKNLQILYTQNQLYRCSLNQFTVHIYTGYAQGCNSINNIRMEKLTFKRHYWTCSGRLLVQITTNS